MGGRKNPRARGVGLPEEIVERSTVVQSRGDMWVRDTSGNQFALLASPAEDAVVERMIQGTAPVFFRAGYRRDAHQIVDPAVRSDFWRAVNQSWDSENPEFEWDVAVCEDRNGTRGLFFSGSC